MKEIEVKEVDISHMIYLGENAEKIVKAIEKYHFFCEIGKEEEFINHYFGSIEDELTKARLLKTIKEINPKIHAEFGLY